MNLNKKLKHFTVGLGLRIENTKFTGNLNRQIVIDTTYLGLFPNFKLDWFVNKDNKIILNYIKKVGRPSFSRLNPNISYNNQNYYNSGNPQLRPAITDEISLNYVFKQTFSISLGYRHKANATIFNYYESPEDSSITMVKIDNYKSTHFAFCNMFYKLNTKKFNSSLSLSITKPYANIPYLLGTYKIRKPGVFIKSSNEIVLLKNMSIYIDLIYNDLGEILLEEKNLCT